MREIKFRAWDKVRKIIVNVVMLSFEQDVLGFDDSDAIEYGNTRDFELMQYTCLKDVRGVEIYEWDIVEGGIEGRRSLIEMSSYEWLKQALEDEFNKTYCNYKIIGNKFQNPELLEG